MRRRASASAASAAAKTALGELAPAFAGAFGVRAASLLSSAAEGMQHEIRGIGATGSRGNAYTYRRV
jgi:hypothetical protein